MFHIALLYVLRKRHRSLIMFVILSVILSCLFICLNFIIATSKQEGTLKKLTGTSLVLSRKDGGDFNIDDIRQYNSVKKVIPIYIGRATLKGAHVVEGHQNVKRDNVQSALKNVVAFEAVVNTSRNVLFRSGVFTLKSGHHIQSGDKTGVLIHESFAKQNHLKVNDTVQLLQLGKSDTKTFRIRGVFSGKKQEQYTGLTSDFSENMMFTSYKTIPRGVVNKLELVTNHPNKVMNALKRTPDIKKNYTIEKTPNVLKDKIASYNGISQMMRWMTYTIISGSVIALSLILVLWLRERIYEIAILLSIGVNKLKIIMQFVFELLLISIPSVVTAFIVGNIVLMSIRLEPGFEGMQCTVFAISYCILTVIMLLSVIIASSVILSKSPKALLLQIS